MPPLTRTRRRLLLALVTFLALDQVLLWTFVTRPVSSIRMLIELTGDAAPPYYQLRPGLTTTYSSWRRGDVTHVHVNALGFRDGERTALRPAGMRRVVVTGDSITFGIGVNDEDAFPQQLQRQLLESGTRDVEVWNAGVPGYAMADHLGLLKKRILPLHPDAVVLQLGRNDVAVPMPLSPGFLSLLRFSGFARVWMAVRFNFFEDAALFSASFRAYVEECRRAGVHLLVFHEGLPRDNEAEVIQVTHANAVPLLDTGRDEYPKLPDDPHYSPEGNRRVAARLLPEVLAAVRAGAVPQ